MKRFDLRLPEDLHERLLSVAERKRRSLHAQILYYLELGVSDSEGGGFERALKRAETRALGDTPAVDEQIESERRYSQR